MKNSTPFCLQLVRTHERQEVRLPYLFVDALTPFDIDRKVEALAEFVAEVSAYHWRHIEVLAVTSPDRASWPVVQRWNLNPLRLVDARGKLGA